MFELSGHAAEPVSFSRHILPILSNNCFTCHGSQTKSNIELARSEQKMFFGVVILKTSDDFGAQGEFPKHPELLDWLAAELRDSGWDVKRLVWRIMTSATYRQSSRFTSKSLERDPDNRLLSRGPRIRMPSGMIRDQALAASGLLSSRMGGPSFKPYQPPGEWEDATSGSKKYVQDHGEALYRRSLYTFWRRIVAPTLFFDAPVKAQALQGESPCQVERFAHL